MSACSGSSSSTSSISALPAPFARGTTGVPGCKGQRTTKNYAGKSFRLSRKGGSFCVPAFGGFGGSIEYPRMDRALELTVRTSTANIYYEPGLGNGTPIVYLNLHFHSGATFGKHLKSAGGVTSQAIEPGQAYTAYGIVAFGHLDLMFPPCYTVATQGPYGGVLPNLGNLFSKTTIVGNGFGAIEIYSGMQVSQEC